MTERLLIIMVRNPVLGQVKTRLAATLGKKRALEIYHKLVDHTAAITNKLAADKVVFYSDYIEEEDSWDNATYQKKLQAKGDLGMRLGAAFEWGFNTGYRHICVIGSDCYELTTEVIIEGFDALKNHHAVMGPSRDGGYYLLGLNKLHTRLFRNKHWGSDTVASETLNDLKSLQLNYSLLRPLNDIDVEADLGDYQL